MWVWVACQQDVPAPAGTPAKPPIVRDAGHASIPATAASAEGFVPDGWSVVGHQTGDLTDDGVPDDVLLLAPPDGEAEILVVASPSADGWVLRDTARWIRGTTPTVSNGELRIRAVDDEDDDRTRIVIATYRWTGERFVLVSRTSTVDAPSGRIQWIVDGYTGDRTELYPGSRTTHDPALVGKGLADPLPPDRPIPAVVTPTIPTHTTSLAAFAPSGWVLDGEAVVGDLTGDGIEEHVVTAVSDPSDDTRLIVVATPDPPGFRRLAVATWGTRDTTVDVHHGQLWVTSPGRTSQYRDEDGVLSLIGQELSWGLHTRSENWLTGRVDVDGVTVDERLVGRPRFSQEPPTYRR